MAIQNPFFTFLSFLVSKSLILSCLILELCWTVVTRLEQRRWLPVFGMMRKSSKRRFWTKWLVDMGLNGIYGWDFMALPRWSTYVSSQLFSSVWEHSDDWTTLPDIYIFTYFLQIFCPRKWRIKSIIIHSTPSLDFSWTYKKSLNGSMQNLRSSQIQWVKLSTWTFSILLVSWCCDTGQDTQANEIWTNLERTTCMFSLRCWNEEHPSSEKTPWGRMGQTWTTGKRKCNQKKKGRSNGRTHEPCKYVIASHIFNFLVYMLLQTPKFYSQCVFLARNFTKVFSSMERLFI